MFLITRLFDALDDFAMGLSLTGHTDETGKMRPYLFVAPVPLAVTSNLCFYGAAAVSDGQNYICI